MNTRTLYAVLDKDGEIMVAYPATQFHNQSSVTLKELHTYDPATQVVVDIVDCINAGCNNTGCIPRQVSYYEWEPEQCEFCYTVPNSRFNVNKFLSVGKG